MAFTIKNVKAREVLDSRGNPTVEVELSSDRFRARAMVPSGVSTGKYEAHELRDGDAKRFLGRGVLTAVGNINGPMARKLAGFSVGSQHEVDSLLLNLDGSADKSRLGANALLAVSLAAARLGALHAGMPLYEHLTDTFKPKEKFLLPVPFSNVIEGGKHAGTRLAVQEFMVVPVGAKSFSDGLRQVSEVYHTLKGLVQKNYGVAAVNLGDEGGFAPPLDETEEVLILLTEAIELSGHAKSVKLAMDCAASEFFKDGAYHLDGKSLSPEELIVHYEGLVEEYPLISIEDPFEEDSYAHFAELANMFRGEVQIVGDDLLVTNKTRINEGIAKKSCSALLLKVNQIGTLSEAMEVAELVQKAGWRVMVSHRAGETEDSFIADLAVGIGCGQIKAGAPARGERTAKYNQLLRIEEELGTKARYAWDA